MAEQHSATPDEWASIRARADDMVDYSTISDYQVCAIFTTRELELLHRIEALEAAITAKPNHPETPDSSLLSQMAAVIDNGIACDRDPRRMAGDVIRKVAVWLRKEFPYGARGWAMRLDREAKR